MKPGEGRDKIFRNRYDTSINFLFFWETYSVSNQNKEGLMDHYDVIRTRPGVTKDGKPSDWYVKEKLARGELKLEEVPADVTAPRETWKYTGQSGKGISL